MPVPAKLTFKCKYLDRFELFESEDSFPGFQTEARHPK